MRFTSMIRIANKNMGSAQALCVAVLLASVLDNIDCKPKVDQNELISCDDIPEAINYLYEHLPDRMALEEKCKRYSVMVSMIKPRGRMHNRAVKRILKMTDDRLNKVYEELKQSDELGAHYMTAIDGFRAASMLGPPFLELIECIKQIDSPVVQLYLEGDELNMILVLYKRVLDSPGEKISFNDVHHLRRFRPAFLKSLIHLFKDNVQFDPAIYQTLGDSVIENPEGPPVNQYILEGPMTESRRLYERRQERRRLATHRHREQERLRKHRLKLLNPLLEQERSRLRQQQRRDLLRMEKEKRKSAMDKRRSQLRWILPKPTHHVLLAFEQCNTQEHQAQQLQQPELHSPQQDTQRYSPGLAELWSEAAPIYESIPTPISHSPEYQQQQVAPAIYDTSIEDAGLEPPDSAATSSHQYREGRRIRRRLRQEQKYRQEEDGSSQQRSPELNRSPYDLSPANPSIQTLQYTSPNDHIPVGPASSPQRPYVEPITPAPHWNHTASQLYDSSAPSCSTTHLDLGSDNRAYDYLVGSDPKDMQTQVGNTMASLNTFEPVYQFNDTDAILQSFLDTTLDFGVVDNLDHLGEEQWRPDEQFDSAKGDH